MLVFFFIVNIHHMRTILYIYIYITVTDTSLVNFTLWTLSVGAVCFVVYYSWELLLPWLQSNIQIDFFFQILGSLNNWHKKRHHSKYDRTKQMLWHQNISTLTLSISKMNWIEFEFFFFPLFLGLKTLHTTYVYVYVVRCTYCSTCR